MTSTIKITGLLLTTTCLCACHPEQYRWSNNPQFVESANFKTAMANDLDRPKVNVYSYAVEKEDKTQKNPLTELSDRGQSAMIDALAKANATQTKALHKLLGDQDDKGKETGIKLKAYDRFERTLVVMVQKAPRSKPGDRLIRTVLEVEPIGFSFAGYKVPATDIKLQTIAQVTNTTESSVSAKLSPDLTGKIAGSAEAGFSASDTKQGVAQIDQRYNNLSVDIGPNHLRVVRESERGMDLEGNVIITPITVRLPKTALGHAAVLASSNDSFFKGKARRTRAEIDLSPTILDLPDADPLTVKATLTYSTRIPSDESRKYYVEGKQDVEIESDVQKYCKLVVLDAADVIPDLYEIHDDKGRPLLVDLKYAAQAPLVFDDYLAAKSFASWVDTAGEGSIGKIGYTLTMGDSHRSGHFHAVARYTAQAKSTSDPDHPDATVCN
ncbi:hypothetical protein AWB78_03924 [Caballeronia calidae]|uniref:Uncharacterized protein n=1 Tax=Caballeronia calidae TaxID=1777139 RepID=A0A158CGS4_9BURK|nr:hypothetical protein [Caballeronia calidae]SAK81573.1 hypothetical protein AWB78_03924 [Caballeronia calidae]